MNSWRDLETKGTLEMGSWKQAKTNGLVPFSFIPSLLVRFRLQLVYIYIYTYVYTYIWCVCVFVFLFCFVCLFVFVVVGVVCLQCWSGMVEKRNGNARVFYVFYLFRLRLRWSFFSMHVQSMDMFSVFCIRSWSKVFSMFWAIVFNAGPCEERVEP